MILLILLILFIFYIQFGFLLVIQIVLLMVIFFSSNLLIGFNPYSKELRIIRFLSIITILLLVWFNINPVFISMLSVLPISKNEITFIDEITNKNFVIISNKKFVYTKISNETVSDLINNLDLDGDYIVNVDCILDFTEDLDNIPKIILSKPFLINCNSSNKLIAEFIYEKLEEMTDIYFMDDTILTDESLIITFNCTKICYQYPNSFN